MPLSVVYKHLYQNASNNSSYDSILNMQMQCSQTSQCLR